LSKKKLYDIVNREIGVGDLFIKIRSRSH